MDEPSAPLSNQEVARLYELIDRLRAQGIAIIYISHRLEEIFHLTNNVTVLRDGVHVGSSPTENITREKLISMMVGREISETYPEGGFGQEATALEVKDLCGQKFRDISFTLKQGEVLGIGGLIGSGRTEVARAIFGADPVASGEIVVHDCPVAVRNPRHATELGIALIPEDRKQQGLLLSMSVGKMLPLPPSRSSRPMALSPLAGSRRRCASTLRR